MTQNHQKKLEAFEMWIWRKMLKISWTQKVRNQEVLDTIQEETISTSENTNGLGMGYDMMDYCTQLPKAELKGKEEMTQNTSDVG